MILNISNDTVRLAAETRIKRVYGQHDVTGLTLAEVEDVIEQEGINYSADYGFKITDTARLILSRN